jgi:hypothetical protein
MAGEDADGCQRSSLPRCRCSTTQTNASFLASLSKVPMCTNGMPGSHTHFHSGGPGLFKHSITSECFCRVTGECLLCVVIPWKIISYFEIVDYFCSSVGSPRPLYIHCVLPSEPNFIFLQRLWALSSIPFTGPNINPLLCLEFFLKDQRDFYAKKF